MKLAFDGQLITTTLSVIFQGKSLTINDVIVDTGSSHTVISPDLLEKIGVRYENGDTIYEAYGIGGSVPFYTKIMDGIQIGTSNIKDFEIDVGMLPNNHNGLLGLDILKVYKFTIDLEKLELFPSIK
ncbi:putative aspartyl protease [Oikeobacillus pervagus]|uniref:Aspartyl protease n=1 Tax=Oikeobacillus pervagus TaxID=1325931 RepID=A0AAJ1T264_9BACI|nr:retropepsin-like aspartic protease [Oikeobacillus pervagus]MDQ0215802.1 putative aspartyl protease [Oikeobacillus pervagus]